MITALFSRIVVLTCGTLFPGYMSFKTVRAKSVEDYVKWMMYWTVFAVFTAVETFTDIFLSWFLFYYEIKAVLILWLLPTMGNGSTYIYKNYLHPLLKKNERFIDQQLEIMRESGRDLMFQYISEAGLYIFATVMNFSNGMFGLLANSNICDSARTMELPNDIPLADNDVEINPEISESSVLIKASNKNANCDEPHTSRGRSRRTRKTEK